jgi:hypothetical protein
MIDIKTIDWPAIYSSLDEKGYCVIPNALSQEECMHVSDLYINPLLYRSTINMQRYRFGQGEYKYFQYPLPEIIPYFRETLYPPLAILANQWMQKLMLPDQFPLTHQALLEQCNANGQLRPTPLILRYEAGGYNTLHQDLYGAVYFPFQVVFALSQQTKDYAGGEFVLVEQIPRAQSRAEVIKLNRGDALIFTTNFRPVKGLKGYYRAKIKHGISPLTSGIRYALGIIFHDAT